MYTTYTAHCTQCTFLFYLKGVPVKDKKQGIYCTVKKVNSPKRNVVRTLGKAPPPSSSSRAGTFLLSFPASSIPHRRRVVTSGGTNTAAHCNQVHITVQLSARVGQQLQKYMVLGSQYSTAQSWWYKNQCSG